ncbi:aminotransferase class V-fold PLP-dependent enzyme [Shewanella dokdonensis]|uniref:Cysteine desulfurase n=1 Tax=Shewanella dokdonensis TaxID=712036 RepID=A0ABX8DH95_9GAMM|nr:cysteine desulfurase [Shewanella dokdonensis]MCL1074325.1 cysteine desulfurase [Shewanella dokdonensis]QVK24016.1 cysteine desulfurase [Shewanella dokdonensis]
MSSSIIRQQFPLLQQMMGSYPLCYLDNAATSQKPERVIQAMDDYYRRNNANVHRGSYQLSAAATSAFEAVRLKVQQFIHAPQPQEVIFTHGTTEALNLLAYGLGKQLQPGDRILVDSTAHHANLVPWQQLAQRCGAEIIAIPLTHELRLDHQALKVLLQQPTKLVALSHVSNVLGSVNDIPTLAQEIRAAGAICVVDGAQAIGHLPVDVQLLGCDFYAFSGHKMYGPTGVGVLWGRQSRLETLEPMLTGGEMIKSVSFAHTEFGELPFRLEAGTPPIAEVIGLGAAIDFLNSLERDQVQQQEQQLLLQLQQQLAALPGITLYGAHADNSGALAFNLAGEHHQDVGILLDQQGVAIRCGHHCAMPLMQLLGLKGCCRASLGVYNNADDIERFIKAMRTTITMLTGE